MKKLLIFPVLSLALLATLIFPACEKEPVEVLADVHEFDREWANCNEDSDVFENASEDDMTIKIKITDECEGGDTSGEASEVVKIDDIGAENKSVTLEDNKAKVICWTVKPNEKIRIKCRGGEGSCEYQIIAVF